MEIKRLIKRSYQQIEDIQILLLFYTITEILSWGTYRKQRPLTTRQTKSFTSRPHNGKKKKQKEKMLQITGAR